MPEDLPTRFEPNGSITLTLGQTRYRLRRPKVGELRDIWEGWEQAAIEVDRADEDVADRRADLNEAAGDPDRTAGERLAAREERKELDNQTRRAKHVIWADWMRSVFDILCADGKLPEDDDDLDGWMVSVSAGAEFLRHWQTVPKASGS